jgi:hypothetical protein
MTASSPSLAIIAEHAIRDEGGPTKAFEVAVTVDTETFRFTVRDIFDVGVVVNPAGGGIVECDPDGSHHLLDYDSGSLLVHVGAGQVREVEYAAVESSRVPLAELPEAATLATEDDPLAWLSDPAIDLDDTAAWLDDKPPAHPRQIHVVRVGDRAISSGATAEEATARALSTLSIAGAVRPSGWHRVRQLSPAEAAAYQHVLAHGPYSNSVGPRM